jgi:hypothetical protein
MSYVIYLAIGSAAVGTIITFIVILVSQHFGVDLTRTLWPLAIPVSLSLLFNIVAIEVYGRYRRIRLKPLTITTPKDGSTIVDRNVTVAVEVANFTIVCKLGEKNVSGQGHVHFYMDADGGTVGESGVGAGGTYKDVADTVVTWVGVEPGRHTFGVQLVNNDHSQLRPAIAASVSVLVK